jgi:archaemetzincin
VPRRWLAALVICGVFTTLAACDSTSRPRESSARTPAPARQAPAATAAPIHARIAAIGDTATLPPDLRRAFDVTGFEPMPLPGEDDWLAHHAEHPQSFPDYLRATRNIPTPQRRVIYLLPVGRFPAGAPSAAQLAGIVHAFFTLEVRTLPAVSVGDVPAKTRINDFTHKRQLLTPDLLGWLRQRLPGDAFALLAVTSEDLYPDPSWNFVFGQASLKDRVGVQSLARQDPAFLGEPRPAGWQSLARRRAAWTLVHELSHKCGLTH